MLRCSRQGRLCGNIPPKKLTAEKSMGMSFFAACPLTGGLSVPRKSGHTRNADLTIMQHGGPDLSGFIGVCLCITYRA